MDEEFFPKLITVNLKVIWQQADESRTATMSIENQCWKAPQTARGQAKGSS
jgi:hypothetical protein